MVNKKTCFVDKGQYDFLLRMYALFFRIELDKAISSELCYDTGPYFKLIGFHFFFFSLSVDVKLMLHLLLVQID
jgi:hypothetical protein